jgi:hypothetical protein
MAGLEAHRRGEGEGKGEEGQGARPRGCCRGAPMEGGCEGRRHGAAASVSCLLLFMRKQEEGRRKEGRKERRKRKGRERKEKK